MSLAIPEDTNNINATNNIRTVTFTQRKGGAADALDTTQDQVVEHESRVSDAVLDEALRNAGLNDEFYSSSGGSSPVRQQRPRLGSGSSGSSGSSSRSGSINMRIRRSPGRERSGSESPGSSCSTLSTASLIANGCLYTILDKMLTHEGQTVAESLASIADSLLSIKMALSHDVGKPA